MSPGVRYMLLATVFFSLMNITVKLLPTIPAIEIVFFRSLITLVMSYAFLARKKVSIFGNNKKLLITRGISGAISLILYFSTLQNIPLAGAVTLQYLAPIFTTLFGVFLVKERVKLVQLLFFGISFGGILVIEGFDPRISLLYMLMGIGSAIFSGISYNIIRKLSTSEDPLVIVFYFPLVTLPIVGFYSYFNWVQPVGIEWLLLLLVGLFTQGAQYFMTKSYQRENLSKVANLNYLGIIYALGLGYVFFDESFNFMTYLGMAAVFVGVLLNVNFHYQKGRIKKAES
jgi:drug/metabolite transporter (DMT)-like permease